MHDEPSGRQLTLALAEWLCGSQASDPRAAQLLGDALLYLLPTMNPDGFAARRRENRHALCKRGFRNL
jgi:carboxypeptidase D